MDIAMLVLSIISTLVAIGSFILSFLVKKDTKQIRIEKEQHNIKIGKNSGIVSDKIKGDISFNGRQDTDWF